MNYATIDNFDEVWNIFQNNKEWFPHVRTSHVRNRLSWGQVILQDGVVITQQQYKRNGKIGKDSDVKIEKGDYIIHQIINSNPKNGNAQKVIEEDNSTRVTLETQRVAKLINPEKNILLKRIFLIISFKLDYICYFLSSSNNLYFISFNQNFSRP